MSSDTSVLSFVNSEVKNVSKAIIVQNRKYKVKCRAIRTPDKEKVGSAIKEMTGHTRREPLVEIRYKRVPFVKSSMEKIQTPMRITTTVRSLACVKRSVACKKRIVACKKRNVACKKRSVAFKKRSVMGEKRNVACKKRSIACKKRIVACKKRIVVCKKRASD
jgi:hypothetical protein